MLPLNTTSATLGFKPPLAPTFSFNTNSSFPKGLSSYWSPHLKQSCLGWLLLTIRVSAQVALLTPLIPTARFNSSAVRITNYIVPLSPKPRTVSGPERHKIKTGRNQDLPVALITKPCMVPGGSSLQLRSVSLLTPCLPRIGALTQLPIVLNEVHLGEEVDMGQLHMQHGGQRGTQYGNELGRVCAVMRIYQVDSSQLEGEEETG